jgi:hypothetical protein
VNQIKILLSVLAPTKNNAGTVNGWIVLLFFLRLESVRRFFANYSVCEIGDAG